MTPARPASGIRDDLLHALDDVPPLGPVALRLIELSRDPNASAADLARVISRDQGLSAKLLRACNSSFIAPIEPVTSLSQAVVTLGMRTVRNLVLFHAIPVGIAGGRSSEAERSLWMHAVGSALGSRLLAAEAGGIDPELAFLGGLFHDLGRMLLLSVRPKAYEALCLADFPGMPQRETERIHLGLDHAAVGGMALRRWGLGDELATVAEAHHNEPATLDALTRTVVAAEWLLSDETWGTTAPGTNDARPGLVESRWNGLRGRLRDALRKEQEFFRLSE